MSFRDAIAGRLSAKGVKAKVEPKSAKSKDIMVIVGKNKIECKESEGIDECLAKL
jgi:hypothetical protein